MGDGKDTVILNQGNSLSVRGLIDGGKGDDTLILIRTPVRRTRLQPSFPPDSSFKGFETTIKCFFPSNRVIDFEDPDLIPYLQSLDFCETSLAGYEPGPWRRGRK